MGVSSINSVILGAISYIVALQGKLGGGFEHLQSLDSFWKASFILGSEQWEDKLGSLFDLVKGFY